MTKTCLAALLLATLGTAAQAAPVTDCPLRDAPFSVDSPLIDVLLSPRATAALQQAWPGAKALPAWQARTEVPSFATLLTLRSIAGQPGFPDVERLDAQLRALPVTNADRTARCARYDNDAPPAAIAPGAPRLLVFEKVNGYLHGPAIQAARDALKVMAQRHGWSLTITDKAGAMTPASLRRFDAVIFNNVSGDVLTLSQRAAFKAYMEGGGGFVGFHGSGGDPETFWDWYVDTLVGARFKGHPMKPQFQDARVVVEDHSSPVVAGLGEGWTMSDEWYSFKNNPRAGGARILATLDERTYTPGDLAMGSDHPLVWTRCVGRGRSFYSAIGHRPEAYAEAHHLRLLEQAVVWAAGKSAADCAAGR
ncbi:ThuA domain-containing protein [Roseateles asaccharophilus]|uniref:Type 1 glutamine amidotransferase n=1 Tax=Roseateles asaccharophilus TaxID=582607 RepID=A0ABU2A6J0_9BURK|nr:ThuA domain-containing protein [Roseateles asaccharophilus]MDR7332824.1 type 1 glutamine amidotransferase [Roseateles asaccharophilus]